MISDRRRGTSGGSREVAGYSLWKFLKYYITYAGICQMTCGYGDHSRQATYSPPDFVPEAVPASPGSASGSM